MMMSVLEALISWMACSHTGYAITLVWVIDLVPSPLGKVHMWLDTLGHGACFLLLHYYACGVFFIWHSIKYFSRSIKVRLYADLYRMQKPQPQADSRKHVLPGTFGLLSHDFCRKKVYFVGMIPV